MVRVGKARVRTTAASSSSILSTAQLLDLGIALRLQIGKVRDHATDGVSSDTHGNSSEGEIGGEGTHS